MCLGLQGSITFYFLVYILTRYEDDLQSRLSNANNNSCEDMAKVEHLYIVCTRIVPQEDSSVQARRCLIPH